MSEFIQVAVLAEIPDPGKLLVEIDERILALFRIRGEIFCIDDVCTHDGGPLSDGDLDGYEIACPRHGARFDVRTGCAKTMPATENTIAHQVKLEGDAIWVRLNDGSASVAPTTDCCSHDQAAHAGSVGTPVVATLGAPAAGGSTASSSTESGVAAGAPVVSPLANSTANSTADSTTSSTAATTAAAAAAATSTTVSAPVAISEDFVREELKRVIDPELFVNIVDLGLVYVVDLESTEAGRTKVKIDMTMTSPMCPAGPQMISQAKQVLTQFTEIEAVEVRIVMDPPWGPDKMSDAARDQLGIF
jgi:3-phenylpropionate/trans-cinnamate dioxygenase ferredoxin subunit